jgi:hypothetical protein
MFVVSVVCCQIEISASGRSLVRRSPTECGVSECDRKASTVRLPWPTRGCCVMGGKTGCSMKENFSMRSISVLHFPVKMPYFSLYAKPFYPS